MLQSLHIFELTLTLESEKFQKLLNRVLYDSNVEQDFDNKYIDYALASKGIYSFRSLIETLEKTQYTQAKI